MFKIALTGKANTGKNTVANLFAHNVTYAQGFVAKSKFMALADPIKEMVMLMFPQADRNCLYGASALRSSVIPDAFKDDKPLTYRQALIDIGTKGREYRERIWIDNFDHRFSLVTPDTDLVIVTDVRYRNEFEHFKYNGFTSIRILRDVDSGIKHSSETDQESIPNFKYDYIIDNNSDLNALKEIVQQISEKLF
jgi:hypothetical protein